MTKINEYVSFKAKVDSVEHDKVYVLLEDGSKGLLYYFDLPNYIADMSHIFFKGQVIYVRKKKVLFTGMVLVTMKGLLVPESLEDLSGEELYGIACKETKNGTLVQISPEVQVCIYGVYLSVGTKILVSIRQNRNKRIKVYLSSVIYDDYNTFPIFRLKYKDMEVYAEQLQAA